MIDKRLWLIVFAAAVIAGLCAFKATRTYTVEPIQESLTVTAPAPTLELYDQSYPSKFVRIEGYLGRNRVIVVFFDGKSGADHSPVLARLREEASRLRSAGVYIMAVSTALPQENRKIIAKHGDFPFPLLSDPDFHVHRDWGRFDESRGQPLRGVFLVDREGNITWSRHSYRPQPLDDWEAVVSAIAEGR
jgi:mycoredoxin-dependent peroxiredoxin